MYIRSYPRMASCCAVLVLMVCSVLPNIAQAHAALMNYTIAPAISLQAMYEGGEPMAAAQIVVYAPDNPAEPWLTGKTDEQGRFTFTPDPAISGEWAVQARQAGHGAMMHVTLGDDAPANAGTDTSANPHAHADASTDAASAKAATVSAATHTHTTGQTPMQRGLMIASIVWGFIGTGLFFARKRKS